MSEQFTLKIPRLFPWPRGRSKGDTMSRKQTFLWMLCGLMLVTVGCSSYYRISDPAGTKEYYTTDIDKSRSGSISFKDAKSGSTVTLQASDVKEISEDDFKAALKPEKK
jgi:hypothetical protein